MDSEYPCVILFQLGSLEVFHRPSPAEIVGDSSPINVYWTDTRVGNVYGPFKSVYETMNHYAWFVHMQKKEKADKDKPVGQVIHVDFFWKRKITYTLPD